MSTNGRLDKLEQQTGAGELPLLIVKQDWHNKDIYLGRYGEQYHSSQLPALSERFRLVVIEYVENWLGGDDTRHIKLEWPD